MTLFISYEYMINVNILEYMICQYMTSTALKFMKSRYERRILIRTIAMKIFVENVQRCYFYGSGKSD